MLYVSTVFVVLVGCIHTVAVMLHVASSVTVVLTLLLSHLLLRTFTSNVLCLHRRELRYYYSKSSTSLRGTCEIEQAPET